MLRYFYRYFKMYLETRNMPRLDLLETARLDLRVGLSDLDYNMHVNNSAYLASLELCRASAFVRSGLVDYALKHKTTPIVASVHIVYTHSLPPFAKYFVTSRVVGWDSRWVYMAQEVRLPKSSASSKADPKSQTAASTPNPLLSSDTARTHSHSHTHQHQHQHPRPHSQSHSHSRSHPHTHAHSRPTSDTSDSILCASAIVKGVLKGKHGVIPPHELLQALGRPDLPSFLVPPQIHEWASAEKHFKSWASLDPFEQSPKAPQAQH